MKLARYETIILKEENTWRELRIEKIRKRKITQSTKTIKWYVKKKYTVKIMHKRIYANRKIRNPEITPRLKLFKIEDPQTWRYAKIKYT